MFPMCPIFLTDRSNPEIADSSSVRPPTYQSYWEPLYPPLFGPPLEQGGVQLETGGTTGKS